MTSHLDPQRLPLKNAEVFYWKNFLDKPASERYFNEFLEYTPWQQQQVRIFGKWIDQPRLTALYSKSAKKYTYSGLTLNPEPYTPLLAQMEEQVTALTGHAFNSCLFNLYRHGSDSNGWHADDEPELGPNPVIASISLGQTRKFHFRHKQDRNAKFSIDLEAGSLLLMKGPTQEFWKHQIPKSSKKNLEPRINLTFRTLL